MDPRLHVGLSPLLTPGDAGADDHTNAMPGLRFPTRDNGRAGALGVLGAGGSYYISFFEFFTEPPHCPGGIENVVEIILAGEEGSEGEQRPSQL
jgi:hypothetical protein